MMMISKCISRFKTRNMSDGERIDYYKIVHEQERRDKYNNYMYTCQVCCSKNVKKKEI